MNLRAFASGGADALFTSGSDFHPDLILIHFQRSDKSFLGDFHLAELAHAFLAGLLLVEQLALAGRIAAVALRGYVLAQGADGFARNDLAAERGLDRDLEKMARDQVFQLLAHDPPARLGA